MLSKCYSWLIQSKGASVTVRFDAMKKSLPINLNFVNWKVYRDPLSKHSWC